MATALDVPRPETPTPPRAPGASRRRRAALRPARSRAGDAWVWLTASALGLCLLLVAGLLGVILVNGLGFFWPRPLERLALRDGSVLLGQVTVRERIPGQDRHRLQLRLGNRDLLGSDFRWLAEDEVVARDRPAEVAWVERREYGPLLGWPRRLTDGTGVTADGPEAVWAALPRLLRKAAADRSALDRLARVDLGAINHELEELRLRERELVLGGGASPGEREAMARRAGDLRAAFEERQRELERLTAEAAAPVLTVATASGEEKEVRTLDVFRAYPPNRLGLLGRARVYLSRLWEFVSEGPRESNTEGGVFPAIFGTVMMVLVMSLVCVPFGVVAALYLREYARQGPLVRLVRIAVNNLAGVPSIVFGIFGLGFFVYSVGGTVDRLFFPEALPAPTYGTGGILWASLTLALLTLPVVIVAAEEALAAVPRSAREASLALGATRWQTVWRVVLPAAAPGILTGLILAMARGAGEVAPLMITGVVKLAADLPLDGRFPFFHPERKFMHLGFHIYDVGFQSPNVEAAKPMVYTTTVLLLLIVVALNVVAIVVRNRLRARYRTSAF